MFESTDQSTNIMAQNWTIQLAGHTPTGYLSCSLIALETFSAPLVFT